MSIENQAPKVAVIGGGTGNFTVLTGLRPYVGEGLTAIVGMADDGGSTGVLRDEYGVLPPGDIRQCLVALSDSSQQMRELMNHRFIEGTSNASGLKGHAVGNLLIAAAEQRHHGDINNALDMLGKVLSIKGRVLPATTADRRLRLVTPDGRVIEGEHEAGEDEIANLKGAEVGFDVEPTEINGEAEAAIKEADMVVIAPGDLYTSIAPALAVRGMREALSAAPGVVQVANLMNRDRHTVGFTVSDHAQEAERIIGAPVLSHVIYNTESMDEASLERYALEKEYPVAADRVVLSRAAYKAIGRPLLSHLEAIRDPDDPGGAGRSLIRHDPARIAHALMSVYHDRAIQEER